MHVPHKQPVNPIAKFWWADGNETVRLNLAAVHFITTADTKDKNRTRLSVVLAGASLTWCWEVPMLTATMLIHQWRAFHAKP